MAGREESYFELLRRPEWQKKRLEVLERADWTCERCGATDRTFNVHHTYYEKGRSPWEYPTESLHCLCEPCHEHAQGVNTMLKRAMGQLPLQDIEAALGFALVLTLGRHPDRRVAILTEYVADGFVTALPPRLGITAEAILGARDERCTVGWDDIRRLAAGKTGAK